MLTFLLALFFALILCALAAAAGWALYRLRFRGKRRWLEAQRHQHRLEMLIGRWIWFRWIHLDCQYWIFHVDFRDGPIEVLGEPPESSYWSFTYNTWTEVNPAINSETVALEHDGSYRIIFSAQETPGNWIKPRSGAAQGVIYFRIYEPPGAFPTRLPAVKQAGRVLVGRSFS